LPDFKHGHFLAWHRDGLPGPGVARLASGLIFDLKVSKTANVQLFSILESFDNRGKDGLNCLLGLLLAEF